MEWLFGILDFFIHLDHHINAIIDQYGTWVYLIVFVIIFCETGLVITPFLPGDSLLFVLGTFASNGPLHLWLLLAVFLTAAILGDSVNYYIGHLLAPKVFSNQKLPFIKREYLDRTQHFYEKYGGKTIIIARFVPVVRTFAPFLAGVGSMNYFKFIFYNVTGAFLWVVSLTLAGYFFGNIPIVEKNFTAVVYLIVVISILPAAIEMLWHKCAGAKKS